MENKKSQKYTFTSEENSKFDLFNQVKNRISISEICPDLLSRVVGTIHFEMRLQKNSPTVLSHTIISQFFSYLNIKLLDNFLFIKGEKNHNNIFYYFNKSNSKAIIPVIASITDIANTLKQISTYKKIRGLIKSASFVITTSNYNPWTSGSIQVTFSNLPYVNENVDNFLSFFGNLNKSICSGNTIVAQYSELKSNLLLVFTI